MGACTGYACGGVDGCGIDEAIRAAGLVSA